jgi:hypothetical protein
MPNRFSLICVVETKNALIGALSVFLAILVACWHVGCDRDKSPLIWVEDGEFALFVVEDSMYGESNVQLNQLKLSPTPLLAAADITAYDWRKHHIAFPETVHKRLLRHTELWGKGFVVAVGNERIYWGLFQSHADSYGCLNPVIMLYPRSSDFRFVLTSSIFIQRSYFDGEDQETEPDPRSDIRIYNSLKKARILINY